MGENPVKWFPTSNSNAGDPMAFQGFLAVVSDSSTSANIYVDGRVDMTWEFCIPTALNFEENGRVPRFLKYSDRPTKTFKVSEEPPSEDDDFKSPDPQSVKEFPPLSKPVLKRQTTRRLIE
jgi:hypothetical protein